MQALRRVRSRMLTPDVQAWIADSIDRAKFCSATADRLSELRGEMTNDGLSRAQADELIHLFEQVLRRESQTISFAAVLVERTPGPPPAVPERAPGILERLLRRLATAAGGS